MFSLKWDNYQSNWKNALNELHKDPEFADVTLISDDKVKFSAHKILLSSCSNLFKFILKSNTQANPLLYLGGVNSVNLGFILDFIYQGEVNIYQEQLDSFITSAEKLEIEGLLGWTRNSHENLNLREQDEENRTEQNEVTQVLRKFGKKWKPVGMIDVGSLSTEEKEKKKKELYERTDDGWKCRICSYTNNKGSDTTCIKEHAEIHLAGLVYICKICNENLGTFNRLKMHKKNKHKHNTIDELMN